jgi:hypothetical protein
MKLYTFYLAVLSKLCVNHRLTWPTPKHVVLLYKIELFCVWPYITSCVQLLNNSVECLTCLWYPGLIILSLQTYGRIM